LIILQFIGVRFQFTINDLEIRKPSKLSRMTFTVNITDALPTQFICTQ